MKITLTVEPSFEPSYRVILTHDPVIHSNRYTLTVAISSFAGAFLPDSGNNLCHELTPAQWEHFMSLLRVTINLVPEEVMGLDGTTITLSVEAGNNCNTIKCWGCQNENHPLHPFIKAVEEFLAVQ